MTEASASSRQSGALERVRQRLQFAWRAGVEELTARFKNSLFGGAWLALGPALLLIVYWGVFDVVLGIKFANPATGESVPFLAPFAIGFFLYLAFSELVSGGASWFKSRRRLIVETDLPLWSIYAILVARTFVQYLFYIAASIAICAFYGLTTPLGACLFILAAFVMFFVFAGVGLAVGMLGAFFGDVREVMPIAMRVLFYVSSITFPLAAIPASLQWLPRANPLTWAVETSRSLLLWRGDGALDYAIGLCVLGAVVWTLAALLYWRLADVVDQVV
jgi:lipopolysaccharide transport system permease protein